MDQRPHAHGRRGPRCYQPDLGRGPRHRGGPGPGTAPAGVHLRAAPQPAGHADLEPNPTGLLVHVRRSKTDTAGVEAYVGIPPAGQPGCVQLQTAASAFTPAISATSQTPTTRPWSRRSNAPLPPGSSVASYTVRIGPRCGIRLERPSNGPFARDERLWQKRAAINVDLLVWAIRQRALAEIDRARWVSLLWARHLSRTRGCTAGSSAIRRRPSMLARPIAASTTATDSSCTRRSARHGPATMRSRGHTGAMTTAPSLHPLNTSSRAERTTASLGAAGCRGSTLEETGQPVPAQG